MIKIKRIYENSSEDDGYRILVDRVWPRGISKEKAQVNLWQMEIAPSKELRKWFGHDPEKWLEFQTKYKEELREKSGLLQQIKDLEKENGTITLLFAARDQNHNNAVVLQEVLQGFEIL